MPTRKQTLCRALLEHRRVLHLLAAHGTDTCGVNDFIVRQSGVFCLFFWEKKRPIL
jgi:hypothetical protein